MSLELNFFNFIYLFSCSFGYVLGIVLLTFGIRKKSPNILMGLSFLFLSHGILLAGLIDSGLIVHFPSLYRTGNLAGLIYAFLPFLYIQYTLFDAKFKLWHLVHLLPAIIYFVDFLPVFMMDFDSKTQLILSEYQDPYLLVSFTQSRFFPDNFHTEFRTILVNFYWVLSVGLVWRYKSKNPVLGEKKDVLRWIQTYLILQLILFVPFYLTFQSSDTDLVFKAVHFGATLLDLSTALFLLYFPSILYGAGYKEKEAQSKDADSTESTSTGSEPIEALKAAEIAMILEKKLAEKVFLKQGYTVYDLAKDSGIPHYLLSQFINQNLRVSFPDYINKARVIHSCELLELAHTENYTLEAIGKLSGFSNRNSFSAAFKKVTGKSPSVYLKEKVTLEK
ncbi:Helix-turn-helix domain-containing protein [Algoriphagus locisalis]|uniref:Helix-turn-helix domain-containing protein n=1 Tax=Algoriphagus locisalis TaxID=305507 RepID=A0A1I7CRU8_9BACT|nr:helix-turn-helix domain-containing protein [Algoriphagus locisalis]SFU02190.1 Helix-turn-helix domain-containing protein [Algoriphagus locisalis]